MDGNNMNMPSMNGTNLGGSTKILNFEEFCAAQSSGMIAPAMAANEPTAPEPELPVATEPDGGDDVTVLDGTDSGTETPEKPKGEESPNTTPAVD